MSALRIRASQAREIQGHGETTYPRECCGVMLGTDVCGERIVAEVCAARNARAKSPETRYLIAPEDLLAIERSARECGLDVIGYYHSHPDAPARPSAHDREHAWPSVSYVVVSVMGGRAGRMTSWVFRDADARFDEQRIAFIG